MSGENTMNHPRINEIQAKLDMYYNDGIGGFIPAQDVMFLLTLLKSGDYVVDRTPKAKCGRCNCPYGCHGFVDLIVPDEVWSQISPYGDERGLLCPTCIIAGLDDLGLKDIPVWFGSGPACIKSTAEAEKYAELWVKEKEKQGRFIEIPGCGPNPSDNGSMCPFQTDPGACYHPSMGGMLFHVDEGTDTMPSWCPILEENEGGITYTGVKK